MNSSIDFSKANQKQLEDGLMSVDIEVRYYAVQGSKNLSDEQIKRALEDEESIVAEACIRRKDFTFSEENVSALLKSKHPRVRTLVAKKAVLTKKQIKKCIKDGFSPVRLVVYEKALKDKLLTAKEIDIGMRDTVESIRLLFVQEKWFTPSLEQYERGLTDKSPMVREEWAARQDLYPTEAQIERGLLDDEILKIHFQNHKKRFEIEKQRDELKSLFLSESFKNKAKTL